MEYILRTNTVSKKYTNYYAVDKVSISIQKGEIYGLIGENGAGKSTLMKMIAGLVEPSEGSIELFGNFVPQTERYRMGCVIESPALYTELTAKQNLEVFRKAYGLSSKESVQQILKQVGLSQYENKIVKKFSLGMKQRLAIGVALLGNPDFLILDEPINGLDPTGIQDMRNASIFVWIFIVRCKASNLFSLIAYPCMIYCFRTLLAHFLNSTPRLDFTL